MPRHQEPDSGRRDLLKVAAGVALLSGLQLTAQAVTAAGKTLKIGIIALVTWAVRSGEVWARRATRCCSPLVIFRMIRSSLQALVLVPAPVRRWKQPHSAR